MAAGRIDVPRGRGFHGSSLRGCDRHVSNTSVVGWKRVGGDQGVVIRQNGSYVSSGVRRLDIRRSGFSCRDEEREPGELCIRNGLLLSGDYEDGEIPTMVDDGVQLPPEKRRKFSPIIWDLEEKKVRASSNDLVAKAKALVSPVAKAKVPVSPRRSDANTKVAKSADSESQVSKVELGSCEDHVRQGSPDAVLPEGMHGFSDQVLCQEEGEFAQARNLYMSRWASDDDSPMDTSLGDDKNVLGEGVQSRKVSPDKVDSGEAASDGSRSRSMGSCDRAYSAGSSSGDEELESELVNCDSMDADESQDGSICVELRECDNNDRIVNMLEGCRSVFDYEKLNGISEGTYGKVYRARNKRTGEIVALKKVKLNIGRDRVLEEYGFPLTALREINILMSLYHPSIVNVKEVVMGGLDDVFMVMECMDHDLKGVMEVMKQPYSTSEVKCLMLQLLQGVKYLHDNWVLHRDLKTSNLLLNNNGELKICDFGMSRQYGSPLQPYTSLVVTLWYRAPELLLGTKQYSAALDMWSVGCIMAELLSKEPLFPGKTEIDQLDKIFRILGTPNEKIWPELSTLPRAKAKLVQQPYNLLRKKFPATSFTGSPVLSDLGFDLLNKLLTYDPEKRISAEAALNHPWFHEVPLPKAKEFMPSFPPQSARTRLVQGMKKSPDLGASCG